MLWYSAWLPASAIGTVKAASVNYALTATATASGSETSAFGPEKAKDGDATTKTSRWASEERDASESNPHWLAMDLCEVKTVNSVIITWERRNPTNYAIETSEDGSTWKAVKTFTSAPAEKEQTSICNPVQTDISVSASIRLTQPQKALPGKQFPSMNLEFMEKNRAAAVKSGML